VLLLDIRCRETGLDILKDVRRETSRRGILMLSMHSEDQYAIRCPEGWSFGIVTKESAAEELELRNSQSRLGGGM